MAEKSKAQVLTVMQSDVDLMEKMETFLAGGFTTAMDVCSTANEAGDDVPEDPKRSDALKALRNAATSFWRAAESYYRTNAPVFGRFAGSTNLNNEATNFEAFHDKLIADAESIEQRELTKFSSMSAGGSNVGNGTVFVHTTDAAGTEMDISHSDTLTITCTGDQLDSGVSAEAERFQLKGTAVSDRVWDEDGAGDAGNSYDLVPSQAENKVSSVRRIWATGATVTSVGATANGGNILVNGDFETWPGTTNPGTWVVDSGTVNQETTNPAKGDNSLNASGNFKISQAIASKPAVASLQAYGIQIYVRVEAAVSAGIVTMKVIDDSTTHATLTVDTTAIANDTWVKGAANGVTLVLPKGIGENLRIEIELASYGGSGIVLIDLAILSQLFQADGGRFLGLAAGLVDWKRGDVFTGVTTSTDDGKTQKWHNRIYQRWWEHAAAAVAWPDT